jgi:hypothetical protein
MCARFDLNETRCKPGAIVVACGKKGIESHIWAGFARQETLGWWKRKGAEAVDIYADRFAERARGTGKLNWDVVPAGVVIRGIVDYQTGHPLIKVVTRPSTQEELSRFDHPRMPVFEPPLFERLPLPEAPPPSVQPELF